MEPRIIRRALLIIVVTSLLQVQGKRTRNGDQRQTDLSSLRLKRFVRSIELASSVFGGVDFVFGWVNYGMEQEEQDKIREQLLAIEERIDQLADLVGDIVAQQKWQEAATIYGRDVRRLRFLLEKLNNDLQVQPNGTLVPADDALEWADNVLILTSDGIESVLSNFHSMMLGSGYLFSRHPLLSVFLEMLDPQDETFYDSVRNFEEYTMSLQVAGYAAWAIALNVKDKHDDVASIMERGKERLQEQEEKLHYVMKQKWSEVVQVQMLEKKCKDDLFRGTKFTETEFFLTIALSGAGVIISCLFACLFCVRRKR